MTAEREESIDKYRYAMAVGVMAQACFLFNGSPEKLIPAAKIKRWQTDLLFEKRIKKRPRHKPGTP